MPEYSLTELTLAERDTPLLLVVDDDRVIRNMLKKALHRYDYEVVEAANGADALELFRETRPDMVLMDVLMPVMNGFDACEAMRAIDTEKMVPIIMLTSMDDTSAVDRAYEAGATDFITKPINWSMFNQRVRYALRARNMDMALRKSQYRMRHATQVAKLGYWDWDLKADRFQVPGEVQDMLGIDVGDAPSLERLMDVVAEEDRDRVRQAFNEARNNASNFVVEHRILSSRQKDCYVYQKCDVITSDSGAPAHVLGIIQDISALKKAEDLILHQAYHDPLTDLPNQTLFNDRLDHALKVAEHAHSRAVVIRLDIDRFQAVNDSLGHEAGDELLVAFAGFLDRFVQEGDTVSRISGNQFAILLESVGSLDEINEVIRHIRVSLKESAFDLASEKVYVTVSMGVVIYPDDQLDSQMLMQSANAAMRKAKSQGGDQEFFYTSAMNRRVHDRLRLEGDLRQVLEQNGLDLYYQPQASVDTREIVSVEALIRWNHPEHGIISPIRFIPLAEETGLIESLGKWVMREAFKQLRLWHDNERPLRCGINLSPKQFMQGELVDCVGELLGEFELPAEYIDLEITETVAMQDAENSIRKMHELKQLGVKLSMDDFGTGYSSLSYLHQFPLDVLKIDSSFVKDIQGREGDGAIARAIIAMARSMGMDVIAEGVETEQQFEFLKRHGCHIVQGYLISQPVKAGMLDKIL